jgi:exopolyphosphatase/guanosine-5'-triphosphate,3'-diphosphate pyrophosphatase
MVVQKDVFNSNAESYFIIVDCGTNTFHINIWQKNENQKLKRIYADRIPVFIWPTLKNGKHYFSTASVQRMRHALKRFSDSCAQYANNSCFIAGTAAFRAAENATEVIQVLALETGMQICILSGETEAFWIAKGIIEQAVPRLIDGWIMDIGGGSTEFICVEASEIKQCFSFEAGVSKIKSLFHLHEPIRNSELKQVNTHLDACFAPLKISSNASRMLYGASGVFDTVDALCKTQFKTQSDTWTKVQVLHWCSTVFNSTSQMRMNWEALIPMRRDTIVHSALLLNWVFLNLPVDVLKPENASLKEGLIFGLYHGTLKNKKK